MAVEDGTYVIVCRADVTKAIDSVGDLDSSGSLIAVSTRTDDDTQLVWVSTDSASGKRMLTFPLTGCAVGASGSSLQQQDITADSSQLFELVADGSTATVDYGGVSGQVFDTHSIKHSSDGKLVTSSDGTAVIAASSGSATQSWAFLPMPSVPDGTYQIVSALSEKVSLDVEWDSAADGTNVQLWSTHDSTESNAQVWVVENLGDGSCSIKHAGSGKALSASPDSSAPVKGSNATIRSYKGHVGQKWVVKPHHDVERSNGTRELTKEIRCVGGQNLLLDACGESSLPGTNAWVWDEDYHQEGQHWSFRPTEAYDARLPVPSSILHGDNSEHSAIISTSGAFESYPSWLCSGSPYQCRYRTRTRSNGSDNSYRTSWGPWRSIRNGRTANQGWDDAWTSNCDAEQAGGRWYAQSCVDGTLTTSGIDLMDIEYQVRRCSFGPQGKGHGGSASNVLTVAYKPNASVTSAVFSPKGLSIGVALGWQRSGNSYTVSVSGSDGRSIAGSYSVGGKGATASVVIPIDKLVGIPSNGETVSVSLTARTCDGVLVSTVANKVVSYASGSSATVSPSVDETDRRTTLVEVDGAVSSRAWLTFEGETRLVEGAGGVFDIPHPFGVEYEIMILAEYQNGTWGVWHRTFDATNDRIYAWNKDDVGFELVAGKGGAPKLTRTSDHDYEANLTGGGEFEVVSGGSARKQSWTVKGVLVSDESGMEDTIVGLEKMGHCWFRDPFGHVVRTYIASVSADYVEWGHAEVSVTMRRTG